MTSDEARALMRSVLKTIAPEVNLDDVAQGETIQEALELDSFDFLQFVTGLAEATGRPMPERDYPKLSTVEGCVAYLTHDH